MAPSATETTTLPAQTTETSTVKLTSNTGPYKELAPIGYDKEAEEKGANAAKVCLFITDRLSFPEQIPNNVSSIHIISHIGAPRAIHHSRSSTIETTD
jgi:hypothetical protein